MPRSLWEGGFRNGLVEQVKGMSVGPPVEARNFVGPVIGRPAWEKIKGLIERGKEEGGEVIVGGSCELGRRRASRRSRCHMLTRLRS